MAGSGGRRWGVRLARAVLWSLAAAHVVEAAIMARRWRSIPALPTGGDGPDGPGAPGPGAPGAGDLVAATPGQGGLDPATRAAVARELEASDASALDLVPGDLPAHRALRFLRRVDPERLGTDPMYSPGGVHEGLAVRRSLAERMGLVQGSGPGGPAQPRDRGELARLTVRAQRHAPARTRLRVAPDLPARPAGPLDRWREIEELTGYARFHGSLAPFVVAAETAHLLAMTAGVLVAPVAGAAALATWSAQPALVLGSGRKPRTLPRDVLGRLPAAWSDNVRTALAGYRQARDERRALAATPTPTPPATGELFEPPTESCPWCGAQSLAGRLDTVDLFLHKPGRFHLDECTACGHVFQNPRLSLAGLDHYYDQFYDGLGDELAERTFAGMADAYQARTDAVAKARQTEPRTWLDVGTGHGHFCLFARHRWPDARFDGLDTGDAVEEAGRRGWLDTAYRGLFPDVAGRLPHTYDVVSMHHYLEHTRDPRLEIEAAAKVLEPGGHLLVEMPDPASPWTRLGRYWLGWLQPQHQHLIPHENLVGALSQAGFEVVSTERATADDGGFDLFLAAFLAVDQVAPNPRLPWRPRPGAAYRAGRLALFATAAPVLAVAGVADMVKNAAMHRPGGTTPTNAYRVVARRT